jgi:hypothetical protein
MGTYGFSPHRAISKWEKRWEIRFSKSTATGWVADASREYTPRYSNQKSSLAQDLVKVCEWAHMSL